MKAFVIYIKHHVESELAAKECLESCEGRGFEAELFEGVTPNTLALWDNHYNLKPIPNSRAESYFKSDKKKHDTKKSCFTNHVILWKKCVELKEPIAVLEHDALCKRPWENLEFEHVLCMNMNASMQHNRNLWKHFKGTYTYSSKGKTEILNTDDNYKFRYWKDNMFKDGVCIPGTASYAVTPAGAEKLLDTAFSYGWDQSDFFINGKNITLQHASPEYFEFSGDNLRTSHGFNI